MKDMTSNITTRDLMLNTLYANSISNLDVKNPFKPVCASFLQFAELCYIGANCRAWACLYMQWLGFYP